MSVNENVVLRNLFESRNIYKILVYRINSSAISAISFYKFLFGKLAIFFHSQTTRKGLELTDLLLLHQSQLNNILIQKSYLTLFNHSLCSLFDRNFDLLYFSLLFTYKRNDKPELIRKKFKKMNKFSDIACTHTCGDCISN